MAECYTCKRHSWTSWSHYGCKMWDSKCEKNEKCPYSSNAEKCPDYKPKENNNGKRESNLCF